LPSPFKVYGSEPMSSPIVASTQLEFPTHPELEGRRVFISGITDSAGELVARGFARQRTRMVLQSERGSGQAADFADSLKVQASSVRLFAAGIGSDQAAGERLARAALGAYGGLDLVINMIGGRPSAAEQVSDQNGLEKAVADDLRPALVLSRAVADHARNGGQAATIMHVCVVRSGAGAEFVRYAMLKSGLEAMAQDQAKRWFSHDICVYAFVPGVAGEPFDDGYDAENVVPARSNFESALCAILLNAAGGRSRWLNGVTVAIPC